MPYYAKYLEAVNSKVMDHTIESLLHPDNSEEEQNRLLNQYNTILIQVSEDFFKKESEQLYIQEGTVGVYRIKL